MVSVSSNIFDILLSMQVVVLAAGKGKRMRPLTEDLPKPLIEVAGKTLLKHKFDALPDEITDIVLVIGYQGGKIQNTFGNRYGSRNITYVEQKENTGTGGALWLTQNILEDRFVVMMGDDFYCRKDIEECLKHEWAICVEKREYKEPHTFIGGNVIVDENKKLKGIAEGEHAEQICRINTALYVLGKEIFTYKLVPKSAGSPEFGLPQTLVQSVNNINIDIVECACWFPITSPGDIKRAESWIKENT